MSPDDGTSPKTIIYYFPRKGSEPSQNEEKPSNKTWKKLRNIGITIAAIAAINYCIHPCNDEHEIIDAEPVPMKIVDTGIFNSKGHAQTHKKPSQQKTLDVLATQVFDDKFESIPDASDYVARRLYKHSLQDLVNEGVITPEYGDLARPLGITPSNKRTDYVKGMGLMWDKKMKRVNKSSKPIVAGLKRYFLNASKSPELSSLRQYRREEIAQAIELKDKVFDGMISSHKQKSELARFLGNIKEVFTPNVLLGYNIHEIAPTYISKGKKKERINAVFKAFYVDQYLKEAGKEAFTGYPAVYDPQISFGPFQFTNMATPEAAEMNRYVPRDRRVPEWVQDMRSLQQHADAAVMYAAFNWRKLGRYLDGRGLLRKFNEGFEAMDSDESENRHKQQILVAGLTASMHHQFNKTKPRVANYLTHSRISGSEKGRTNSSMHYRMKESLTGQLAKYYDSSAEGYLVMKVFHKMDDLYGKR